MTLTVRSRFRGPATSGNGGYVAGLLAESLTGEAITVTLRTPPPLDVPMNVISDSVIRTLVHGDSIIAEAIREADDDLSAVPPISIADAHLASRRFPGLTHHPFPECFVCGPDRSPGDGLRLFPGRLEDGRTACVWDVARDVADRPEFVWAALDCPSGWAAPIEEQPMVLGQISGRVIAAPAVHEACTVMGLFLATEGRKTFTRSTAYGADGRVLGVARSTWIALTASTVPPDEKPIA
jgi:hypothetical protein